MPAAPLPGQSDGRGGLSVPGLGQVRPTVRRPVVTVAVSPSHTTAIIDAQEEGATESNLHEAVAEAVAGAYFRQSGGGCAGLEAKFTDVGRLKIKF